MNQTIIPDPFNCRKSWLIKRYSCGHYYWSQSIEGRVIYPFKRVAKRYLLNDFKADQINSLIGNQND